MRSADLAPPLGFPGGREHVIDRIDQEVPSPRTKDDLGEKVERGEDLSNPEAAQVYEVEGERGPGGWLKKMEIGPHAQYRMDLRGVTVPEVRLALSHFLRAMNDWKNKGDGRWDHFDRRLRQGEAVEWVDPLQGLFVAFVPTGRDSVKVVTTYWKGESDPAPLKGGTRGGSMVRRAFVVREVARRHCAAIDPNVAWVFSGEADRKRPAPQKELDRLVADLRPAIDRVCAAVNAQMVGLDELGAVEERDMRPTLDLLMRRHLKTEYTGLSDRLVAGLVYQVLWGAAKNRAERAERARKAAAEK